MYLNYEMIALQIMGAPNFLYSLLTSKTKIHNIKQWFWLVTNRTRRHGV